jgi:uncharacterized protein
MENQAIYSVKPKLDPDDLITYSGLKVDVFNPKPEMFSIVDIAHALSNICRFGGHTKRFYSVAEHSIRVSHSVEPEFKLQALMHDAGEAYLFDMPSPIKKHLIGYEGLEQGVMRAISKQFQFPWPMSEEVEKADKLNLELEWELLFNNFNADDSNICMDPFRAESVFLFHFFKYSNNQFSNHK